MFNVFFLKIALHLVFLELADGGQAVHRVPCETADRLRDDEVNAAGEGILHHFVKTTAFRCGSRADPFVRIYRNKLPILAPLYVAGVIIHLRLVAGLLFLMVGADTGIACHPALFPAVYRSSRIFAPCSRYRDHLCHRSALPS